MNINEELHDLEEDVRDYERILKHDEQCLIDAKSDVQKSKVYYAEAIIKLDKFRKEHKI